MADGSGIAGAIGTGVGGAFGGPIGAAIGGAIIGGIFGNGSKNTTQSTKWTPPDYLNQDYLNELQDRYYQIANAYGSGFDMSWPGEFVKPLTQGQIDADAAVRGQMIPNFINQEKFLYQDAAQNNALMNALAGDAGNMVNPYASATNPYLEGMWSGYRGDVGDMQNPFGGATNPYLESMWSGYRGDVGGMQNEYGGATNPYLEDAITKMRENAEKTFSRTTGAATDAALAQQGAYGGSAYNEFKNAQSAELADVLGRQEAGMRNDQMARALGVREADIGRQYGAAGQELAGRLGQYGLGAGLAESGLGREYGAAGQELAQRYGQFGNAAQGQEGVYQRQMQALGLMPTMETSDANIARQLFGLGEMSRTLDQQQLEGEIGRWNQNVRQPMDVLDWARTGLMSMSGPGNTVSQSSQPGSPVAGALGGGALGAYVGRQPWFQELFSPNPVPYTPVPYTGFGSGGSPGYDPFNVNP